MSRAKAAERPTAGRKRTGRRAPPPAPPPKKSPWRHWRWWLAGAVVVLAILFIRLFVYPAVAPQAEADAVVVFDGDGPGRLERALELMNGQAAAVLVIPNGTAPDWPAANRVCAGGAPFEVLCPDTEPVSARGDARLVGALASERGWGRVAVVTGPTEASRAALLLHRCTKADITRVAPLGATGVGARLSAAPAESARYLAALAFRRGC